MKRYSFGFDFQRMEQKPDGGYVLFTDHEADKEAAVKNLKAEIEIISSAWRQDMESHEAAIKKAVKDEREAIVQYLIDQGTIVCGRDDVYFITDDDIAAIRSRGEN